MKRALVLSGKRLTSALAATATCPLKLGDTITATRALYICPDAIIEQGEIGTVDSVNPSRGSAEVLWRTRHRGLDGWDNHTILEPFDTDDILDGLEVSNAPLWKRIHATQWTVSIAASVVIALGASIIHNYIAVFPYYELSITTWSDFETFTSMFTRTFLVTLGLSAAFSTT